MRALIVGASESAVTSELLMRAARGCDLVVGADGGARLLSAAGLTPDLVVGDLDSLDSEEALRLSSHGSAVEQHPAEKDVSDLDLALEACRVRGAREVVLCGVTAGRVDHALAAMGSICRSADLRPCVIDTVSTTWLLSAGYREAVEVHAGATASVMAVPTAAVVTATGFRWPLDRDRLEVLSSWGLSNVACGAGGRITIHVGTALVTITDHLKT